MPNPCCSPLCPCECVLYQIRRCLSNPNCLTGQRSRSDKNLLRPVVKPLILFVGGVIVEQCNVLVFDCSCLVNVGDIGPLCQLDGPLNLLVSNSGCSCPTHVSLSFVLCCMSPLYYTYRHLSTLICTLSRRIKKEFRVSLARY